MYCNCNYSKLGQGTDLLEGHGRAAEKAEAHLHDLRLSLGQMLHGVAQLGAQGVALVEHGRLGLLRGDAVLHLDLICTGRRPPGLIHLLIDRPHLTNAIKYHSDHT